MLRTGTTSQVSLVSAQWSLEEFGGANFGDQRLTKRLLRMAARAAAEPSGKITDVFDDAAERQGAYDFVSNPRVEVDEMLSSMASAVIKRAEGESFIFVPVDGSSLTLTDRALSKDFGEVGAKKKGARGLQVVSAIGVDPKGVPLGIAAMTYWVRKGKQAVSKDMRTVEEKELKHWLTTFKRTTERLKESNSSMLAWFQVDREGDAWPFLQHLSTNGHLFTVRGSWNRRVRCADGEMSYLQDVLSAQEPLGTYTLKVTEGPGRSARLARMSIRATRVTLDLLDKRTQKHFPQELNAVRVREESDVPEGQERIEWTLLTNHPIEHLEEVCLVVYGYSQRWRIEEFHRTWKQGGCNVESTQLHATDHVERWATLLAAVAMRIERLKYLSRNHPERPATEEFSKHEIKALILLKRRQKKKTETVPDTTPTIGQATRWIADLGGYTGKSSGGPPGSVTIRRGLEKVATAANVLRELDDAGVIRM